MTRPPVTRSPFGRTVCACATDSAHCIKQPGYLIPGDLERISGYVGHDVTDKLWASPGAVVGDTVTGEVFRIETITPRLEHGRCVFLTDDNRCSIHAVAPFGCAYFDAHMSKAEGDRRSTWGLQQIQRSPTYRLIRDEMKLATSWRGRPVEATT